MTREVMMVCKRLRESDLPLMTRAVEAGKTCGAFYVCELFEQHERSQAMVAMRISGMFAFETERSAGTRGRPRMIARWNG